jgi:lipopolysaccharide export system protein LptA
MNRSLKIALALLAVPGVVVSSLVVAQNQNRIITIKGRYSGDLRMGPYSFKGDVQASVQNLQITAPEATLKAPDKLEMSQAQGKRTATFTGNVTVTRGRMTANGPGLEYKEETGLGVLSGPTKVIQKPEKAGDDDVIITSQGSTFDVDTDVSTSRGSVKLVNGNQSGTADRTTFDEKADLACLTDPTKVVLVREPKKQGENKLTINAKESRMLTDKKLLIATGGVTLISGGNTTTGDALYYDDNTSVAYVVGSSGKPAKNVNEKTGSTVVGGTIERNINRNQVKQAGQTFAIPFDKFKCPTDK